MNPRYILISGPPGAGKDTAGKILHGMIRHSCLEKFALPLMASAELMGFDMRNDAKDTVHAEIGMSRRQYQIWLSEMCLKSKFGQHVFGESLARRTKNYTNTVIITDSGFREEAETLVEVAGRGKVARIHMKRNGTSYAGDSRSDWLWSPTWGPRVDLSNDGSILQLERNLGEILLSW